MAGNSLLPIIDGLREKKIILLSTSPVGRRWLPVVRECFIASFQSLGLQAKDGTSTNVSNVHTLLEPRERDHFILLHGVERGKSIRMPSEIASLPPNRLAIIVKSRRVVRLKGLSDKEHFRVMVVDGNLEDITEVTRRIAVIFGAPCIKAVEKDNVIWSEDPVMITVRRGKDEFSNLRLSIVPRKVHSTSPFECITLVSSSSSVQLKAFMHIQSVNGQLLDGRSQEEASKVLGSIEEGPVFLMVRRASKDRSKLTSPATPLTDTPLDTPGHTPPGLPPSLPPQPPPLPVCKGVCRLMKRPFELKWTEKPIEVHLRTETLDLIPALITEPNARQQKASTIIGYADNLPVWSACRGHLIVAVNGVEVLAKGPQDVEKMISETPDKTLVSLVVYLCEEGPKPLAENVYSDIIKSYNPRQDHDTEASSKHKVDFGFEEQRPINKHPSNTPVYFAGSSRECSTKVYEVMTRGETTLSMQDESSIHSWQLSMEETTSNVQAKVDESHSFHREDTSPSTTHPQFANCIKLKRSGSTSSLHSPVEKPSLLTTKCVNDDWNPFPSFTRTPESLDNCGKFILQNINFRQLQEENITLCPLQEQLYLKPNTICVYSIDLEELTLSPHTSFTRLYEFLCFFHLRHNPKGMQVILVGAYDSSTEYGSTLDDAHLDWFCRRIPEILQDKHINELLFEDLTKSRIHLIPFDLANPEKGTASLQDVIKECIKKYHLRVEATIDDNQKMPQSLKQWPLFLGKVMELSSSQPLISKEDLKRLASGVLWIEGGQLFDQCLECLYQSSLLQTNGPVADSGLLTSPDLIVRVIAQLGDPNLLGRVLEQASRIESHQLKDYACVTTKLLHRTIRDLSGLSPDECSCLVEWMKYLKIALPVSSGASQDSYLFIPAITMSSHWKIKDNAFDSKEAIELYVNLPESMTLLFFHDLVNSVFSQIDLTEPREVLTLDRACTKVRIPKLGLYPRYPMTFDVVLQYSVIQSQIKISIKPWQADLVTTAERYFKNLILKLDPSMESQLIIGPSFTHPLATARAHSMSTFHFLEEVQRSPPSPSVETKPTYVVDAAVVRRHIASGIEPQVPIETRKGSYKYFLVSEIPGLNQWVYDPIYLHAENNGQDKKDMSLMRALSKVAEWLLPEPKTCSVIACENGIVSDAGPEALSLASNVGEPAAYKLIRMWQARELPISRLREALLQHHHNVAAAELEPFCHDTTSLLWSEKSTDSVPVKYSRSYSLASTVKKSDSELTSNSVAVTGRKEDSFKGHTLMSPLDAPQPPNSPSMSERSGSSERSSANLPIEQSQDNLSTNSQDDGIVIDPEDTTTLSTQDPTLALIEQNHLQTHSEEVLTRMCWIPFGIHTFKVLPQGGLFHFGKSSTISYGWGSAGYIQVPEDAFTTTSLDVRCALIMHGSFSLPDGYQFASPVVYLTFDTTNTTKPITLHLPHWCKNDQEDWTDDNLMFVMAPHSLGEGEESYQFQPIEGGRFLIHDGVLSITGHNSLFAVAFKNTGKSLYRATYLSKHDEVKGHISNDVVFTYAHPIWQQIFEKYRSDLSISRTELFSFNEDKVLMAVGFPKSGQGWDAFVNGKSQVKESRISYSDSGISDEAELERAVVNRDYPPRISFEVLYAPVPPDNRRSKFVRLKISGSDEGLLEFLCEIYINHPPAMSNGYPNPPTNGVHEPHMSNGTETDLRKFLQYRHEDFVSFVDARAIVMYLKGEHLIPEPVSTRIESALTMRDANGLLFEHLLHQGVPGKLARVFEVMKNEPGYDRMNKLGEEMGNELSLYLSHQ